MSYQRADGRYVYTEQLKLSQTITATGNGTGVDVGAATICRGLVVTASAVGGTTPSITINFQTSPDNSSWTTQASYTAITANGTQTKTFSPLERYARLSWTVTGTTPTFTINAVGDLV
jgi:hypothetical protein